MLPQAYFKNAVRPDHLSSRLCHPPSKQTAVAENSTRTHAFSKITTPSRV